MDRLSHFIVIQAECMQLVLTHIYIEHTFLYLVVVFFYFVCCFSRIYLTLCICSIQNNDNWKHFVKHDDVRDASYLVVFNNLIATSHQHGNNSWQLLYFRILMSRSVLAMKYLQSRKHRLQVFKTVIKARYTDNFDWYELSQLAT